MEKPRPTITVLSTADYGNPIWTNKQHLAQGLRQTNKVNYIDSLGLRSPTFKPADLRRIVSKATGMLRKDKKRRHTHQPVGVESPNVISPHVLPWHAIRPVRRLNEYVLVRQILRRVPAQERDVLWTFSPLTYGLERHFRKVVYHSVDLLHTFPGVPSELVLEKERALLAIADRVIASSLGVADHLRTQGAESVKLWENVADTSLYSRNASTSTVNRAIFSGNLTPTKIDFGILRGLAENGSELALAGPISIDGTSPGGDLDIVLSHPSVTYLGVLAPDELAKEVRRSRVGLVPYLINEHTSGIFPMKVYEYLSAGLAVVSTPLPSLTRSEASTKLTISPREEFAEQVRLELASYSEAGAQARSLSALSFSWENRFAQAHSVLDSLVETRSEER